MKATISTPRGMQAGSAIIEIRDAPPMDGKPVFRLESTRKEWLSPAGWQKGKADLVPVQWNVENGVLFLEVGPEVVDRLDPQDGYRLEIGDAACTMRVDDILQSPMGGDGGVGRGAPSNAAAEPKPEKVMAAASRISGVPSNAAAEAERAKEAEDAGIARRAEEERRRQEAEHAAQAADAGAPPPVPEESGEKRRGILPVILVILLILAAAAAGAWFWLSGSRVEHPAPPARQEIPAPPPPSPTPVPPPAASSPLSDVRKLLGGSPSADAARDAGVRLRVPGADADRSDAAFLALEYAAEKGDAEAMFLTAQFYDPLSALPRGTLRPDVAEAHGWYAKARDRGNPRAAEALAALRAHVEQKAREGDADAARLLNAW